MNIPKITSKISNIANKVSSSAGKVIQGDSKIAKGASKVFDKLEANGGDNSFFGLATIMGCFVLIPRISSALKRNPNDKESTKDEIMEIICRDIPTILVMLFGLKSLNTVISNISTKATGIPMVNKGYKLFDENVKGVGAKIANGAKNIGKNILDTINPLGGSVSYSGDKIASKYTNYDSIEGIQKLLKNVPNEGGNTQKVFDKIMDGAIALQDETLYGKKGVMGLIQRATANKKMSATVEEIKNVEELKESLIALKKGGAEKFLQEGVQDEHTKEALIGYFKNPNNSLAFGAKAVNAALKTLALGIEISYLGFGLPAMNQKRLEKKYLKNKPAQDAYIPFNPINDRHIKAQEIKLYSNFLK